MANPAQIVTFESKDKTIQKALIYQSDQRKSYSNYRKIFIRLVNEDFTPKTIKGKEVIALKDAADLTIIGFQD